MLNMVSLLLISAPVGFIGSLTGPGGASILVPLLVFSGHPVKEAIASPMVTIIATSSGSASSYVREKIIDGKVAMYLEMFTIIGEIMGATVTTVERIFSVSYPGCWKEMMDKKRRFLDDPRHNNFDIGSLR